MSAAACLAFLTATGTVSDAAAIRALVEGRGPLPSLARVQVAAVEALEVPSGEEARSWSSRARWRGAVPRLELGVGSNADLDVSDSFRGEAAWTKRAGRGLALELGARFELGELVFSDAELRANRERLARSAAVALARERVTRVYFERVEICLLERKGMTPELALSAARLDGLLRALTAPRTDDGPGHDEREPKGDDHVR